MSERPWRAARLWLVCSFLAYLAGCTTRALPTRVEPLRSPPSRYGTPLIGAVRTIVIDAGHGGYDAGASYFGLQEKALNLDIAKRLRDQLQVTGLLVAMTREADAFIPLSGRSDMANRLTADLFVSIHTNANPNDRVFGAEVYYPRISVVSPSAQWPPSVEATEVALPTITVKQILWDMVLGRTRVQSHRLASSICGALRDGLQVPCKVKPARFIVLREAWMPAVLVEVGYVSNGAEASRLRVLEYRQVAAESIARGIVSYIREIGAEHI